MNMHLCGTAFDCFYILIHEKLCNFLHENGDLQRTQRSKYLKGDSAQRGRCSVLGTVTQSPQTMVNTQDRKEEVGTSQQLIDKQGVAAPDEVGFVGLHRIVETFLSLLVRGATG